MQTDRIVLGTVTKTHGIHGEVRVMPCCDGPDFLARFQTLIVGGQSMTVEHARIHKNMLLVKMKGIDTVEAAIAYIGKNVAADAQTARAMLSDDRHFICDLLGCDVVCAESHRILGTVTDVLVKPAHDIYVVQTEHGECMIPVVDEFVTDIDIYARRITVRVIEGMLPEGGTHLETV